MTNRELKRFFENILYSNLQKDTTKDTGSELSYRLWYELERPVLFLLHRNICIATFKAVQNHR